MNSQGRNVCVKCAGELDDFIYCGALCDRQFHFACTGMSMDELHVVRGNNNIVFRCQDCSKLYDKHLKGNNGKIFNKFNNELRNFGASYIQNVFPEEKELVQHVKMNSHHDLYTIEAQLINKSLRALNNGEYNTAIEKLRLECFSHGATGILSLSRALRNNDLSPGKKISKADFKTALNRLNFKYTREDLDNAFQAFDKEGNGNAYISDILGTLRPEMPENRQEIIEKAFNKMDKNNQNIISMQDLKRVYSVKRHPLYMSGEKTENEIFKIFMHHFDGGDSEGMITREEFLNYYSAISASVDTDGFFDLLMRQCYKL